MLEIISIVSSLAHVSDIAVDPAGFVWVATDGGVFAVDSDGEVGATDRRVRGLDNIVVQDGILAVHSENGWKEYEPESDAWNSRSRPAGMYDDPAIDGQPTWAGNAVYAPDGARVATLGGTVAEARVLGDTTFVRTVEGSLFTVGHRGIDRVEVPGPCGNFITGLTRWNGALVVGTFADGVCVFRGDKWERLDSTSTMVNEVLAVPSPDGEILWVATAEGLIRMDKSGQTHIYVEVADEAGRGAPGLNHAGVNHLSWDGTALWVADVLGPTKIFERDGNRSWNRHRWSVSGHSYQTIAACGKSVWAGSEDDGLAVRGLSLGSRNGKSDWHHVNALDGLPEDWIMATACDGPDAAWVGTYRNGVGRVDNTGWQAITGLESAWVQTLATEGDTLWVGTADGVYRVVDWQAELVSTEDVWSILPGADTLTLGTRTGIVTLRVD